MKKSPILPILFILAFCSCKKLQDDAPGPAGTSSSNPLPVITIPNGAALKIKLLQNTQPVDETMVTFNDTSHFNYSNKRDAAYFTGFGIGSLSTLTSDSVACAIQQIPYKPGMAIRLDVGTRNDGDFLLNLSYANNIPFTFGVWLKDNYLKDSVDLKQGPYKFSVARADTNSFGRRRFSIVLE